MTVRWTSWRLLVGLAALLLLLILVTLMTYGLLMPANWYTGVYAGGWAQVDGARVILQPPFGFFTRVDVFTINDESAGSHLYLLGSDPGGRDLLALVAHAAIPSLELVALVVAARLIFGALAGLAIGFGWPIATTLAETLGGLILGFPYLALAIVVIESFQPQNKTAAFVAGMAIVGWRDVAFAVAERIEHVRSQSFAEAATSLGTVGVQFFRLHVLPFLRPVLAFEVPFQASAALVLLAELGYLQIFIGPIVRLSYGPGENSLPLLVNPELGQMLANTYRYLIYREMAPVLVPAFAVAALALSFELIGTALRGRWRLP